MAEIEDLQNFYRIAFSEAQAGLREGGIPIGAALTDRTELLGSGHNRRLQSGDPTAHAEIDCLRAVGLRSSYRTATLYTTLTPCFLCAGAVVLFGIRRVVVGETRTYDGAGSLEFLRSQEVEIIDLDDEQTRRTLERFIEGNPAVWREDIGRTGRDGPRGDVGP